MKKTQLINSVVELTSLWMRIYLLMRAERKQTAKTSELLMELKTWMWTASMPSTLLDSQINKQWRRWRHPTRWSTSPRPMEPVLLSTKDSRVLLHKLNKLITCMWDPRHKSMDKEHQEIEQSIIVWTAPWLWITHPQIKSIQTPLIAPRSSITLASSTPKTQFQPTWHLTVCQSLEVKPAKCWAKSSLSKYWSRRQRERHRDHTQEVFKKSLSQRAPNQECRT